MVPCKVLRKSPMRKLDMQDFTMREREVLDGVRRGLQHKEIAKKLHISTSTVKFHIHNIYLKLGVHARVEVLQTYGFLEK